MQLLKRFSSQLKTIVSAHPGNEEAFYVGWDLPNNARQHSTVCE